MTAAGQADADPITDDAVSEPRSRRALVTRIAVLSVMPSLVTILTLGAAYMKFVTSSARDDERASVDSVEAAKDSTVAMLSYAPDTAEGTLTAARDRMTGGFRDSYAALIHEVVIPGAKQKKVFAVATVPAAASVSATSNHAVVLVYVNQAITMGNNAPTQSNSVVQVTLERSAGRWLVSGFDPK